MTPTTAVVARSRLAPPRPVAASLKLIRARKIQTQLLQKQKSSLSRRPSQRTQHIPPHPVHLEPGGPSAAELVPTSIRGSIVRFTRFYLIRPVFPPCLRAPDLLGIPVYHLQPPPKNTRSPFLSSIAASHYEPYLSHLQTLRCLKSYPEIKLRVGVVQPEVAVAVTAPEPVEEALGRPEVMPAALRHPHHSKTKATLAN